MMVTPRFLPYLPPQNGDVADPLAAEALDAIQEDLEWLLTVDGPEFWGVLRSDSSLTALVDSFLRHARRPFDEQAVDSTATELSIWRLMLAVLHRSVCVAEAGAPALTQRGATLSRLLDMPRLLDLSALYWASEPALLAEMVQALFRLQPALTGELPGVAGTVASNLLQVVDACLAAASQAGGDPAMMRSVLDGAQYLRDACLTLCALLGAYPAAAPALLARSGGLLEALAALHDSLLPALARLGPSGGSGGGSSTSATREHQYRLAAHIELASERAALLLLTHAYLEPGVGPSRGVADGASAAGPAQRGEALLGAAMLLGHGEEEARGGGGASGELGGLALGRALAVRHGFGGAVEAALLRRAVALDEAQAAYLAALLGVPSLGEAPGPAASYAVSTAGAGAAPAVQGGGGGAAGVDSAVLMSQISQIQDLLPDYGEGYLAVCLDAYEGRPEAVIDALLGGGLYPGLAELDPHMTLAQYRAQFGSSGGAADAATRPLDKGKRPLRAAAAARAGPSWAAGGSGSSGLGGAPPATKPRPELSTAKYLDVREGSYRESLISTATALQWEDVYDDEHDDSLDDLIHYGADGVTEAEEEAATALPAAAAPSFAAAGATGPLLPPPQQLLQAGSGFGGSGPGRGRGGARRDQGKLWVLDGRIYNYPKPGAKEVGSREDAERQLQAAQQATLEIHGLGPGGNKPLPPGRAQQWQQRQEATAAAGGPPLPGGAEGGRGGGGGPRRGSDEIGRGGGRGGGGGPQGGAGAQREHRFKDQHKAAIGNHHRKDRALKKAMGAFTG